ncbi:MAG TPA: DUF4340 domain-containing protein [Verrucomicrobiae bacterium]|nr:DUF4340 domain-containing protein [Verrucomicrobiae bacterium]
MHSKTTGVWFVIASGLAAFIFVYQHYFAHVSGAPTLILPHLRPDAVTSVQVIPASQLEIRADHTNGNWMLAKPIVFPAQSAAVEALLDTLQKLSPAMRITAAELRANKNLETDYGLDNPQTTIVIETPDERWQLLVGNRTAPGNQVYLGVVGVDGAFVADSAWLKLIPHSVDEWRDTSLVTAGQAFDWIVVTNGASVIELRDDPATHLWRMIRPLPARADTDRITDALQRLQSAHVTQFITDDPNADPGRYGLQPPGLSLWLGQGTNFSDAIDVGKSPADDLTQVYARREGWNTIFTTAQEPLTPWFGAMNDFRDRNLLELTAPVAEIEVGGPNHFILRKEGPGTNDWKIVGEKFPADAGTVQSFIQALAGLQIERFVKDVVTKPDLQAYGLATPQCKVTLRSSPSATDTNNVLVQLLFGGTGTNEVFVRRADEDFIYAVAANDYNKLFSDSGLFSADWLFRDRHIWSFNMPDVASVTIHQNGRTRELVHDAANKWSLAPGSTGVVTGRYIEQAVQQLSNLTADDWLMRNFTDPSQLGITPNSLQITVELRDGRKDMVDFGAPISNGNDALAAVTLDGQPWAFVFPAIPYQFVVSYLTIPPNGM